MPKPRLTTDSVQRQTSMARTDQEINVIGFRPPIEWNTGLNRTMAIYWGVRRPGDLSTIQLSTDLMVSEYQYANPGLEPLRGFRIWAKNLVKFQDRSRLT